MEHLIDFASATAPKDLHTCTDILQWVFEILVSVTAAYMTQTNAVSVRFVENWWFIKLDYLKIFLPFQSSSLYHFVRDSE